jgi:hypothetical protein
MSFAAVVAGVTGLASAGAGIYSANKAAGAQKDAAKQSKKLAEKQFDYMDHLQGDLYRENRDSAINTFKYTNKAAAGARGDADTNALSLYRSGTDLAQNARRSNLDRLSQTRRAGVERLTHDRNQNIGEFEQTERQNLSTAGRARNAGLNQLDRDRRSNLAALDPYATAGTNAMQAYASNLGIGSAPEGYSGLTLSPGAQFQLEQGRNTVEGGAAGAGGLYSGATMAQLERMRNGEVAQDRDNQQDQLFALGGVGQNAVNAQNSVRDYATAGQNDLRSQYTDRASGYRNTATNGIADSRNGATAGINALRGNYATAANGTSDDFFNRQFNNSLNYTNALTNSSDTMAQRNIDALNQRFGNLFQARGQRANLMGSASQNYTNAATYAAMNRGAATAGGAIGVGNAITGGINNGLGIYAQMGGFSGGNGGGYGSSPPPGWQAPWLPPSFSRG